jgi:hypothetical protein
MGHSWLGHMRQISPDVTVWKKGLKGDTQRLELGHIQKSLE